MVRKISVVLIAAMLLAFSACSASKPDTTADIGLVDGSVLTVGMSLGYPPFESYSDDGVTPEGLDVDLANAIGDILGVKVEFKDIAWDSLLYELNSNKCDVLVSAITINDERAQSMDFSESYVENWQSITVLKGSPPVSSVEALAELRVGFQDGTVSDDLVTGLIEAGTLTCNPSGYYNVINCFEDLRNGRLDAVVADSTVAVGYAARQPDTFEVTWHQSSESGVQAEEFGIGVRKGNEALLNAVNDALKQLEENGKLNSILENWLS